MSSSVLANVVADHPFLKGMGPAHLQILTRCAMFTHFDAGQIIFHEGDIANRFYLIQEGKVCIETRTDQIEAVTVHSVGAGDVVGWSWLFPPYYWHFSACAFEATRAIFFYGTRLRECCEEDPDLGYELMKRVSAILVKRLEVTSREAVRLATG